MHFPSAHRCPTLVNPIHCTICNRRFQSEHYLSRHMKIHDKTRYQCMNCNRTFSRKTIYKVQGGKRGGGEGSEVVWWEGVSSGGHQR